MWEDARFPIVNEDGFSNGTEGVVETYTRDRLIIAFFGAASGEQQGNNDVLIVTSDDNGDTWSEPETVFPSGTQPAQLLRLYKDKQGRLHLLWGRQVEGLPIPDELWHSSSNDGGDTWTNPERFMVMEKPPGISENGITDYDVVSDSFGCIHWVARTFELPRSNDGAPSLYARWCSLDEQWQEPEILTELPQGITFAPAVDGEEQILYLFWTNEINEGDQLAMFYSTKSLIEPKLSPVIAKSGPLQLHANYPNPFNPSTRISFTLEEPADVVLTVFDISGRQIMRQNLGTKQAGLHSEEVNLEGLTSGTYIYEVELNNTWRQQSTMMLIK